MSKVKFNAKSEWEYLENFKILQKSLKLHQVDKVGIHHFPRSKLTSGDSQYQSRDLSSELECALTG